MSIKIRREDALSYHMQGQPGKIEVVPTKTLSSQLDLALAYSPGVAEPCKEIAANKDDVYKYTAKGNLVAVISNGTEIQHQLSHTVRIPVRKTSFLPH